MKEQLPTRKDAPFEGREGVACSVLNVLYSCRPEDHLSVFLLIGLQSLHIRPRTLPAAPSDSGSLGWIGAFRAS